jgi:hypothetical protein
MGVAMLRSISMLVLVVSACAPKSDDAPDPSAGPVTLAYDPARAPGTYELKLVGGGGELASDGGIRFELRSRADARFDLFVTMLDDGSGPIEDPRMSAHPVHDLSIDARGPADARLNPRGFLKDGSELATTFVFLLPQTPPEPVDVGATWTGTRTLPLGKLIPEHPEITITHELLRFEPCPAPAASETCAVYRFESDTGPQNVTVDERRIAYRYHFAGTGWFSTAGHVAASEATLEGSVTFDEQAPVELTVRYELSHH